MKKKIRKPFIICFAVVVLLTAYELLVFSASDYIDNIYDKLGSGGSFTLKDIPYKTLSKEFREEITKEDYNSAIDGESAEEMYKLFVRLGEISKTFDKYEVYGSGKIHRATRDPIADKYIFKSGEYEYTIYYNLYFVYNIFNPIDVIFIRPKLCGYDIAAAIRTPINNP